MEKDQKVFRCAQASLYEGLSVRPSVGPSVDPSETHCSIRSYQPLLLYLRREITSKIIQDDRSLYPPLDSTQCVSLSVRDDDNN